MLEYNNITGIPTAENHLAHIAEALITESLMLMVCLYNPPHQSTTLPCTE